MGQTDARTDIYGLGVTLYHLVTGQDPCEPPYEILPIRQWNPALSSGLEAIIQKCTQINPDDRYQSCDELMYALEHYAKMDNVYRKAQKKKLASFVATASITVTSLVLGVLFNVMSVNENKKNYTKMISISTSTNYTEKVNVYCEAIKLYPYRTEAYIKLLDAYSDNGTFNEEQSKQIMSYYNDAFSVNNESEYDKTGLDVAKLNYELGITYFYLYDEEKSSMKARTLKAEPFFAHIVENAPNTYENKALANSYYSICEFYKEYVANNRNTKEPNKETYVNLLNSLKVCIDDIDQYDYPDILYIKLTVYEAITDLLHNQRRSLCVTGIEYKQLETFITEVYSRAEKIVVTQEKSNNKKSYILEHKKEYLDDIENVYLKEGQE